MAPTKDFIDFHKIKPTHSGRILEDTFGTCKLNCVEALVAQYENAYIFIREVHFNFILKFGHVQMSNSVA